MSGVDITVDASGVLLRLTNTKSRVETGAETAVETAATKIFEEAQQRVPVRTGALKRSGRVINDSQPGVAKYIISYGDERRGWKGKPTIEYAPIRHEIRTRMHPDAYKWLEQTLLTADVDFRDEIIKLINSAF